MKRAEANLFVVAMLVILTPCGATRAIEVLEPDYIVQTYASYRDPGIRQSPWDMVFADNGNLYVTHVMDSSIWCITPDGTASEFVSGLAGATGIVWAADTNYGDYLYVAITYFGIVRVGLDGTSHYFASRHCAGTLGLDRTGNYGGYIYTTTGCQDHTYRVYPDGNVTMFTSWPTWIDGGGPHNIAFDNRGNFGGLFYVAAAYTAAQPHVSGLFTLDPQGHANRFAEDIVQAHAVDFDPAEDFNGDMFVIRRSTFDQPDLLWRVSPDGSATEFAILEGLAPRGLTFGPDGAMYVGEYLPADELVIISRISRAVEPDQWTQPMPLAEVNTDTAEEWAPFLSYDGLTLYFARVRSNTFYYGRIFEATRQYPFGPFTEVREVTGPLNSAPGHQLCPWVSPDNLRMYYHNERGGRFSLKVSERRSVYGPWPEGTDISELNMLGAQLQAPKLTPDELIIVFGVYELPGGKGGYDLWMASRPDRYAPFSQVRNLEELNTASGEWAPYITPDGLTLYFGSNRNNRAQLFRTTRVSLDAFFDPPEHLPFFDTPDGHSNHPCLSSDGRTIYFVSQFGQDRSTLDIYVSHIIGRCTTCLGDLDENGWISVRDLLLMTGVLIHKGPPYIIPQGHRLWNGCADMNGDRWIMPGDLMMLVSQLHTAGPPYVVPCQ